MFCAFLSVFLLTDKVTEVKEPVVKREQMRYDGKTFEEWRTNLLTELKASRRLEALKAMQAFAPTEHSRDVAFATVRAMGHYNWRAARDEDFPAVNQAACGVLSYCAEAAKPALLQGLKSKNRNEKAFVVSCLNERNFELAFLFPELSALVVGPEKELGEEVLNLMANRSDSATGEALLKLFKEGNAALRCRILDAGEYGAHRCLSEGLKDTDDEVRSSAVEKLSIWSAHGNDISKELLTALDDNSRKVRKVALGMTGYLPANSAPLLDRLRKLAKSANKEEREQAEQALKQIKADTEKGSGMNKAGEPATGEGPLPLPRLPR